MKRITLYLISLIIGSQAYTQSFAQDKIDTKPSNNLDSQETTSSSDTKQSINDAESFADYKKMIDDQFGSILTGAQTGNAKDKVILFNNQGYFIKGRFSKGIPVAESYLSIFKGTMGSDLLLRGIVINAAGACTIKGVRFNEDGSQTYGEFFVSNYFGALSSKPKEANGLEIVDKSVKYHVGKYIGCDAIVVLKDETSMVVVDGKSGGRSFDYLEAPVNNETISRTGYANIFNLLLTVERDVRIDRNDGSVFHGEVQPFINDVGIITFEYKDGSLTYSSGPIIECSVFSDDGYKAIMTKYDTSKSQIARETLYMHPEHVIESTKTIGKSWDYLPYLTNCVKTHIQYSDGSSFEGESDITIKETEAELISYKIKPVEGKFRFADGSSFIGTFVNGQFTKGVYYWSNGDSFEGEMSGEYFYGLPVNGKTEFRDGTTEYGNWLATYQLSPDKYAEVASLKFPSVIREAAMKIARRERIDDYISTRATGTGVSYFNPFKEYACDLDAKYMSYDKKNSTYYFSFYEDKVQLAIRLDNNNKHTSEAFYEAGELIYITHFTWYSNGEIESIRTYDHKRKELYISCDFYSDGTLKSALKYGPGNNGKNIILLSKVSLPTYGGYMVRLYDLDGNFEKITKWMIGENEKWSLFEGSYCEPMAPRKFDITQWEKAEAPNKFIDRFLSK